MSVLTVGHGQSTARTRLLKRFSDRLVCNHDLDRTMVSFQGNRSHPVFQWFKYREGFSAGLVEYLIRTIHPDPGTLLDPFAGSGTALFVSQQNGWDATGIELLPVGHFAMSARIAADRASRPTLRKHIDAISSIDFSNAPDDRLRLDHVSITRGAFPIETEAAISGYRAYLNTKVRNDDVRLLLDFALFSILESISYTRKDGQYLRWDSRAPFRTLRSDFDKGPILDFNSAIRAQLRRIIHDLHHPVTDRADLFDHAADRPTPGAIDLRSGSCLDILPQLDNDSIDLVITSPPYCNRYDYTRTYALELVYLGCENERIKQLRQSLLSCTVENREKVREIQREYTDRGQAADFHTVMDAFRHCAALHEVLALLDEAASDDRINNANIPRMVRNYFLEMSFVIFEMARLLRTGGKVAMVNDNVQYIGEEVPVDLILCDLAEAFGLRAERIWMLPRGKGNSSQQMAGHGRRELRKCVYVWAKP